MPFTPELHYFYLYIKKHIEEVHKIHCERADEQYLTKPISDKINDYIINSDVIVADCTGRNPNVFYELGISHAHGKKVILITSDDIKEAPSDIKYYEFIKYNLDKHIEFLKKLDNALLNVFIKDYEKLYKKATEIFKEFRKATDLNVQMVSKELFLSLVLNAEKTRDLPSFKDVWDLKAFLLPKIVEDSSDFSMMNEITKWLTNIGSSN